MRAAGYTRRPTLRELAEPEQYAAQNPLGGPAKIFDAIADAIRAGDDYHATLRRYGFAEVKALAEPEPPVAWWNGRETVWFEHELMGTNPPIENPIPLYAAPTPRKPLTDEEIDRVTDQQWAKNNHSPIYAAHRAYARAVERAHGIGGGE
jgi:hypothetical protein